MYWRLPRKGWQATGPEDRHAAFRARVEAGPPPGVLAYRDGQAVGWVQVTPRAELPRFNGPRTASRPDHPDADLQAVWAVSCFFIHRSARGVGLMTQLARAACAFAAEHGAQAVEAGAIAPQTPLIWGEGYVGIATALARAGFVTVEQRTKLRVLMRWRPD